MKSIYKNLSKKALLVTLIAHLSVFSFAGTYYVSNSGNDANSGLTTSTPWKSLTKVNSFAFKAGDQILFERGSSFYGTLNLHYRFGTAENPIVYGAYGSGELPVISGFTTASSWTNEGGGIYSTAISSESQTNMVTIDGVQYAMGRYPNSGYLTYESASTNVSITDNQLANSPSWIGAEVVIFKNLYDIDRCGVDSHTGGLLGYTSLGTKSNAETKDGRYFFQNSLQALDQFGEWYHDSSNGRFYIYFGSDNTSSHVVRIATINYLLSASSGEDFIAIENISFIGSIKDAVSLRWQNDNITISNCNVSFAGLDGIELAGTNGIILGNNISNCNSAGIMSYVSNGLIAENVIRNSGIIEGQGGIGQLYRGAIVLYRDNVKVTDNSIENAGWNGIDIENPVLTAVVKNNYIKNVCINAVDQGATYQSGSKVSILLEGNIIDGSNGNGIYLDEYTTNTRVWNNTVTNCKVMGIKLHKAHDNSIKFNISFDNASQLGFENWLNVKNLYNDSIVGNKFIALKSQNTVRYVNWYNDNNVGFLGSNFYARPIDDFQTFSTNLLSVSTVRSLDQWQELTKSDTNSKKSPQTISSDSDLQFEYNATQLAKTITLSQPMIDVAGVKYTKSITLQPFTSVVLMKDNNPVVLSPVYNTEYVSICDGANYNGWIITGKYSRTLTAASGADSIVTTYLTVNPKYTVTEDITITEGESYQGWTASGQYKRVLSSVSGCDSTVITNLTVQVNSGKQSLLQPTRFIPVWQGEDGYNLMNFVVTSATIEDLSLEADDEIGVFSQGVCVGSVRLTQAISASDQSTYLSFVASQNTGSNNGYISGETIAFKIWDNSTQTEWTVNKVTYQADSAPVTTSGLFTPSATAIASLESYQVFTQTVSFKKGNNLFSTYLVPENADIATVMDPLCKSGALYKMQDEAGRSFEYWGSYGGWVNKIGNITSTEGYNVTVNFDCTLQISGRQKVATPLTIPLKKGWNFISFPHSEMINAMTVVQPLIDQRKLSKVQDESGNSIENLKGYGWVNNIGNFVPGKAYKVYASSVTSLTIQPTYTKSVLMMAEPLATEFFKPVYEGNGVNHMNINLVDLALLNLEAGDEIAAFDGDLCVGALKLSADNLNAGFAAIVASYNTLENTRDGFTDGDLVSLALWKSASGEKVELNNLQVIDGQTLFARNSSVLLGGQQLTTKNEVTLGNNETTVSVFPNPCKGNFSVRIQTGSSWADGRIEIFDFSGKLIETRIISENTEAFSLNNKPSGMYLVKTTSGLTQHTDKLVVNN